ncbi:hypothetical protein J2Z64_000616 [Oceanobacillus polygoni]|uniref:Uncharacterized protein n=1 Tax=Oceanobacillus polygoni TaxID=1235259 RepID=A0A9X1CAA7_9BACI|nr:hypothetical protein [Oceanobacillus polygoni]
METAVERFYELAFNVAGVKRVIPAVLSTLRITSEREWMR